MTLNWPGPNYMRNLALAEFFKQEQLEVRKNLSLAEGFHKATAKGG